MKGMRSRFFEDRSLMPISPSPYSKSKNRELQNAKTLFVEVRHIKFTARERGN